MCFPGGGGGSTQAAEDTAAEQAKQEAAAAEAKAAEQAAAASARAAEIERARTDAIATYKAEQEAKRQAEADKIVSSANIRQERISKFGAVSTAGRASRRSGSRGRRSLITGLGGGIGYYDRFSS
jgi:hypothetical protein